MSQLFVFDNAKFPFKGNVGEDEDVFLFPLTGSSRATLAVEARCRGAGFRVQTFPGGRLINAAAERLRDPLVRFVADLSQRKLPGGETLSEVFSFGNDASSWWFSLTVEKSPYKSRFFLRCTQFEAVCETLKKSGSRRLFYAGADKRLAQAFGLFARSSGIEFRWASTMTWRGRFLSSSLCVCLLGVLRLFRSVGMASLRARQCRRAMGSRALKERLDAMVGLCTAFPNFDPISAGEGKFRNEFTGVLPDSLRRQGQKYVWVLIYTPSSLWSVAQAFEKARTFESNVESIFFLHEVLSATDILHAFFMNIWMGIRFWQRRSAIAELHQIGENNIFDLVVDDWFSAFGGAVGFEGLLNFRAFGKIVRVSTMQKLFYFTEAHAWEKALILARNAERPGLAIYGYQSATVSSYLLNYWNHPSEFEADQSSQGVPFADRLVCNGSAPWRGFRSCGWPVDRLVLGEALRYRPLGDVLRREWFKKKKAVLVALSISPDDSTSSLRFLREAFLGWKSGEIWLRPHPFLDLKKVLKRVGLFPLPPPFGTQTGPLYPLLEAAPILVAGESSVTIEGLAHGCAILAIDTPEWVNMSPLRGYGTSAYRSFDSPEALRREVEELLSRLPSPLVEDAERERVVRDFFELDWDEPRRLLALLS